MFHAFAFRFSVYNYNFLLHQQSLSENFKTLEISTTQAHNELQNERMCKAYYMKFACYYFVEMLLYLSLAYFVVEIW